MAFAIIPIVLAIIIANYSDENPSGAAIVFTLISVVAWPFAIASLFNDNNTEATVNFKVEYSDMAEAVNLSDVHTTKIAPSTYKFKVKFNNVNIKDEEDLKKLIEMKLEHKIEYDNEKRNESENKNDTHNRIIFFNTAG